jgi:hypothetical protein
MDCDFSRPWDSELMGYTPNPLPYYLEPDGFAQLVKIRGPRLHDYQQLVPRTYRAAASMFDSIHERRLWGKQLDNGSWHTETAGKAISCGKAGRTRKGEAMELADMCKHLCGRGAARGATDQPAFTSSPPVSSIKIDVDQDGPWQYRNEEEVWIAMDRQSQILVPLGLRHYTFRTGGRGMQIVIPLPVPTPHPSCSVIVRVLQAALPEALGTDFDSSLQRLLRLPGGIHATGKRLGAWIDGENRCLYPPDQQLTMMADAWLWRQVKGGISAHDYERSIAQWELEEIDWSITKLLTPNDALAIVNSSSTELGRRLKEVLQSAGAVKAARHGGLPAGQGEPFTVEIDLPEERHLNKVSHLQSSMAWAQSVWDKGFEPGHFWSWFRRHGGGEKGILAAHILFGDQAEVQLLAKAKVVPADEAQLRQRLDTIKSFCKTFTFHDGRRQSPRRHNSPSRLTGDMDPLISDLATRTAAALSRSERAQWSMKLAERVVELFLIAMRDGATCTVRVSLNELCAELVRRHGDRVRRQGVASMLARLQEEAAFVRSRGNHVEGEADEWMIGSLIADLDQSGFAFEQLDKRLPAERRRDTLI